MVPISLKSMRTPDPIVLTEDDVSAVVVKFFALLGFSDLQFLRGKRQGVDVSSIYLGMQMLVESNGSQSNANRGTSTVFDDAQLWDHLGKQVLKLMTLKDHSRFLFLANPDIPRIRNLAFLITPSLDTLGFLRIWVRDKGSLVLDIPPALEEECRRHRLVSGLHRF